MGKNRLSNKCIRHFSSLLPCLSFFFQINHKFIHLSHLAQHWTQGSNVSSMINISGYVYLIFDSEKSVKALLASCTHDFCNGGDWYFKISSRRMRCKEVTMAIYHSTTILYRHFDFRIVHKQFFVLFKLSINKQ